MKKSLLLLLFCFTCIPLPAQDSRLFIQPGRETFINFPSEIIGSAKTLNIFLPEEAAVSEKSYPVVYLLAAGSSASKAARAFNARSEQKVIFVGLNFTADELQDADKIRRFFSRELIPYITVNYRTVDRPSSRVIVGRGESAGLALSMLAMPEFISNAMLVSPSGLPSGLGFLPPASRVYARGARSELAALQQVLASAGLVYGKNYAYRFGFVASVFDNIDLKYLLAPQSDVVVNKLKGSLSGSSLVLGENGIISFTGSAVLKNGQKLDFAPVSFQISPMYLDWAPALGTLRALNGAEPGVVRISVSVDKAKYSGEIKLKKQRK